MTEDEAKTKWCPFARTLDWDTDAPRAGGEPQIVAAAVNRRPGDYDRAGNETVEISGRHRCIASACMAWRWRFVETNKDRTASMMWPRPEPIYERTDDGHCGLAGARFSL